MGRGYGSTGRGGASRGAGGGRGRAARGGGEWSSGYRGDYKNRQAAPPQADGTKIPAVDFLKMDHVDILRPYPGETGSAFVRRSGARNDMDVLDLPTMARRLTHMRCELANRAGRGVGFVCASIHRAGILSDAYEGEWFEKTGLEGVLSYFQSDDGRRLLESARHLDVGAKERPTEQTTTDALEVVLGFLGSQQLVAEMKRVNLFCAHMYSFSANVLQGMALMTDRQHWAEELAMQSKAMPTAVKHFIGNCEDDDALVRALVACYGAQVVQAASDGGADAGDPLGAAGGAERFEWRERAQDGPGWGNHDSDDDDDPLLFGRPDRARRSRFGRENVDAPEAKTRRFGAKRAAPDEQRSAKAPSSRFGPTADDSRSGRNANDKKRDALATRERPRLRERDADDPRSAGTKTPRERPILRAREPANLRSADTKATTKERTQAALRTRAPATPATSAKRAVKSRVEAAAANDDHASADTDLDEGSGRDSSDDSEQAPDQAASVKGDEDDVAALADVIIDWRPEKIEEGHALLTRWQAALKKGNKRAVTLNAVSEFLRDIPPGAAKLVGFARAAEHTTSSDRLRSDKAIWLVDGMLKETEALVKILKDNAAGPTDTAPDTAAPGGGCATPAADEVASPAADDNAPAAASADTVPAPAATEAAPE